MRRSRQKARSRPGGAKRGRPLTDAQQARLTRALNAHRTGNLVVAENEYRTLLAEGAVLPQLCCNLAAICAQTARRDEADLLWKQALEMDPNFVEAQMNLADSFQMAGNLEQAGTLFRKVLASRGDLVIARYLLANILKAQGRMSEAAALYRQIMEQQPGYTQAHFSYSGIHRYEDRSDPHIDAMLSLLGTADLLPENRIHLEFALAKAFEDIGDYPTAFKHLESGNSLRAREFNYSIEGDADLFRSIIRAFSSDALSGRSVSSEESTRPIFIVGMPRSGTSLVEKILASHSQVFGAGELDYLFALGTSSFLGRANDFQFQSLDTYDAALFGKIASAYLEKIRLLNDSARHVTDKLPFNFMMIGLIRLALPNAVIIHCVRDPRDTCLSIFKQNFTTGNYRFAYDLRTVAQFHNLYEELMRHWHRVFPGAIYDISYEALTKNAEKEIRKLLSVCQLDFEESCLNFQKTKGVVRTASAFQVRQPMYTSSVGLWRKYEEFLGPMLNELKASEP